MFLAGYIFKTPFDFKFAFVDLMNVALLYPIRKPRIYWRKHFLIYVLDVMYGLSYFLNFDVLGS